MRPTNVGLDGDRLRQFVHGFLGEGLPGSLSAVSFWAAIALPLLYLPMLATGIGSGQDLLAFLGLFGLHVLALVGGHPHADGARR